MLIIQGSQRVLQPQMVTVRMVVNEEFEAAGHHECVLTSGFRPGQQGKSLTLHTFGFAEDYDSPTLPESIDHPTWDQLRDRVQRRLGKEYQVLAHASPRAHLHVEYDPR